MVHQQRKAFFSALLDIKVQFFCVHCCQIKLSRALWILSLMMRTWWHSQSSVHGASIFLVILWQMMGTTWGMTMSSKYPFEELAFVGFFWFETIFKLFSHDFGFDILIVIRVNFLNSYYYATVIQWERTWELIQRSHLNMIVKMDMMNTFLMIAIWTRIQLRQSQIVEVFWFYLCVFLKPSNDYMHDPLLSYISFS